MLFSDNHHSQFFLLKLMINHLFYVKLIVLKNLIIISSSCELIVLLVDVVSKFVSRESMAVFNDYNTVINVELV